MKNDSSVIKKNFLKLKETSKILNEKNLKILVIRGLESVLVSEESVTDFVKDVPIADFENLETARHMIAGDNNDIFTEILRRWLSRNFNFSEQTEQKAKL